jgi:hypothetical protein
MTKFRIQKSEFRSVLRGVLRYFSERWRRRWLILTPDFWLLIPEGYAQSRSTLEVRLAKKATTFAITAEPE